MIDAISLKNNFEGDGIWCPEPISFYVNLDYIANPLDNLDNIDKAHNVGV